MTPIQSALAIKEYSPNADTLMLDDVAHFCWSDVFGGETVAPGRLANVYYVVLQLIDIGSSTEFFVANQSWPNGTGKEDLGTETKK